MDHGNCSDVEEWKQCDTSVVLHMDRIQGGTSLWRTKDGIIIIEYIYGWTEKYILEMHLLFVHLFIHSFIHSHIDTYTFTQYYIVFFFLSFFFLPEVKVYAQVTGKEVKITAWSPSSCIDCVSESLGGSRSRYMNTWWSPLILSLQCGPVCSQQWIWSMKQDLKLKAPNRWWRSRAEGSHIRAAEQLVSVR